MTDSLAFSLRFEKFNRHREVHFGPGLHIIYGASGCGKTALIHLLAGMELTESTNFVFELRRRPDRFQVIFQNPEDQIVAHTLEAELAFSLECQNLNQTTLHSVYEAQKSKLPFIDGWNRHPETLSGGEKEILNLVTTFSIHPACVLIDDGLSFLNRGIKESQIKFIRKEIHQWKMTVLWFTSDVNDLEYGDSTWGLTLSDFHEIALPVPRRSYHHRHEAGTLNLTLEGLTFNYPQASVLLQSLNIRIQNARSVGLVGQNGRGKTTLAQLLTGVLTPSAGSVALALNGKIPTMAYLDQFPEKTLSIETPAEFLNRLINGGQMDRFKVQKCIKTVTHHQISWELIQHDSALDIPWSTLRLALVVILAHCSYDLLILDEPTFGLGWDQKIVLSRFLSEILKRKHLILISHDREFIAHHCDHILNLDDGQVTRKESVLIHD